MIANVRNQVHSDPDIDQAGLVNSISQYPKLSLGGVLGYGFGNFRVDGEIALRVNNLKDIEGVSGEDTTSILSYMANEYFDIPTGDPREFIISLPPFLDFPK